MNAKGKSLIIETEGNSPESYYVQSASFNGKPLEQCWLYREDIYNNGGTLKLVMGTEPDKGWSATNAPAVSDR